MLQQFDSIDTIQEPIYTWKNKCATLTSLRVFIASIMDVYYASFSDWEKYRLKQNMEFYDKISAKIRSLIFAKNAFLNDKNFLIFL